MKRIRLATLTQKSVSQTADPTARPLIPGVESDDEAVVLEPGTKFVQVVRTNTHSHIHTWHICQTKTIFTLAYDTIYSIHMLFVRACVMNVVGGGFGAAAGDKHSVDRGMAVRPKKGVLFIVTQRRVVRSGLDPHIFDGWVWWFGCADGTARETSISISI